MAYFSFQRNKLLSKTGKNSEYTFSIFHKKQSLLRDRNPDRSLTFDESSARKTELQKNHSKKRNHFCKTGSWNTKSTRNDEYVRPKKTSIFDNSVNYPATISSASLSVKDSKKNSVTDYRKMSVREMKRRHTQIRDTIDTAKRKLDQDIHNEIFRIFDDKKKTKTLISDPISQTLPQRKKTIIHYL